MSEERAGPPRAEHFGLLSEWDAAGGGDPAYHREQAYESFQQAALSLVFLAPGLILLSFPVIRWLGLVLLVGLGSFSGFMFFNLISIGSGELKRAERMRDPEKSAAAKAYKEALARWRKDAPLRAADARPRMTLEQATGIVQDYTHILAQDDGSSRPMLRPLSHLPYPKADIQRAFKVILPSIDPEQETMLKYAYAALAHFVPDDEFAWVDEAWQRRQARVEGAPGTADRDAEQRLTRYEQEKSDEWQGLLREIYAFASSAH